MALAAVAVWTMFAAPFVSAQTVDATLLRTIADNWHDGPGGDITGDGQTDSLDILYLAQSWGRPLPTPTPTPIPVALTSSSPAAEESGVAVTRETVLRFSGPLSRQRHAQCRTDDQNRKPCEFGKCRSGSIHTYYSRGLG